MLDSLALLKELVAIPGPPGQEGEVRDAVARHVESLGFASWVDAKGNLLIAKERVEAARIMVAAHLDEIALMVSQVEPDASIRVVPLGGVYPWKWGEQPVEVMAAEAVPGILSFGSIHTSSPAAVAQQARLGPLTWDMTHVFTGLSYRELEDRGVRPGTRVALGRDRRTVGEMGPYLASYFIDDRADLVAMLLALEAMKARPWPDGLLFAATVYEETGGEGARYLLQKTRPDVCIALEIGPSVPESPFTVDAQPTIWVQDGYSTTTAADLDTLAAAAAAADQQPHWQALSRGGSDASCTAALGLCARPITLGLPVENSHGLEIMHRDAPPELSRLLIELLPRL
jgi:putative aminopeptidase FrvX